MNHIRSANYTTTVAERTFEPSHDDGDFEAAVVAKWRREGRSIIATHWAEFQRLLEPLDTLVARRSFHRAALQAQVAANYAVFWHTGLLFSRALEGLIRQLGEAALPFDEPLKRPKRQSPTGLYVLHVASRIGKIGGHGRMLRRWIAHDCQNIHSLALTRQNMSVPEELQESVGRTGGALHVLNKRPGGFLAWAARLQTLYQHADLVVLHTHNMDIIPFLAMAGMRDRPPVLLLNHADHLFWLGAGFVDLVISTRHSGLRLCADRRGIPSDRNAILPLCLEPANHARTSADARQILGLPQDAEIVLTIARSLKFKTFEGQTVADALVPVLLRNPRLHLVAVGPGNTVDWSAANRQAPGQIHKFAEHPKVSTFFEAADIYLDSFPFVSITSMFEAGLHGLPVVSRSAFGPTCAVLSADSPGLDGCIIKARGLEELHNRLECLATDGALRRRVGALTRNHIQSVNMGPKWQANLNSIYEKALLLPRRLLPEPGPDNEPLMHDIDLFSPFIFGGNGPGKTADERHANAIVDVLQPGPVGWRILNLARMAATKSLAIQSGYRPWKLLLPEWLISHARALRSWEAMR